MYSYNRYQGIDPIIVSTISKAARKLIRQGYFIAEDLEDLEQELLMDVLLKIEKYNSEISSVSYFAKIIVSSKAQDLIKHKLSKKRNVNSKALVEFTDFLDIAEYDDEFWGNKHVDMVEYIEINMDIDSIAEKLPNELYELCQQLKTMSISEIIRETGISRRAIYKQLHILRTTFTSHFDRK